MKIKLSIIIHGPFSDNAYSHIFKSLNALNRHDIPYQCIIVGYENERKKVLKYCTPYVKLYPVQFVFCKDLINPGYFNINRQIYTVKHGLSFADDHSFVVKLRNDQWINWEKFLKVMNSVSFLTDCSQKFVSTNCFSRKDRLYHPSDMFMCGFKEDMMDYFDVPLFKFTHMDCQLFMLDRLKNTIQPFRAFLLSPESMLFRGYLSSQGWKCTNTYQDSYNAINKYIYMINTWDINLRWNKKRNADLPAGTIILPYKFTLEPFAGAPKENARCYSRHDFSGKYTVRDFFYITFANYVFDFKYVAKPQIRHWMSKILFASLLPMSLKFKLSNCYAARTLKRMLS